MWPRRSTAATHPPAPPSRPVAPSPAPVPPSTCAKDGDCSWLLRAVASKKKKTKTTATSATASSPGSGGWTNHKGDGAKPSKKRPLDSKQANTKRTSTAKLPRGIGWSQPSKAPAKAEPKAKDQPPPPAVATGESFEEVLAEIYGCTKPTTPAALEDDETPSLPLTSSLFLPDHDQSPSFGTASSTSTASIVPSRIPPSTVTSSTKAKWEFAAPSAIQLDAFNAAFATSRAEDPQSHQRRRDDAKFAQYKDEHATHTVSDNFVRLNMRKRFKGSTGKAKKLPAYLRSRGFVDAEEKAQRQQQAVFKADIALPGGGTGGLLDDGIDFIEECLEMLKRHEAISGQSAAVTATTTHSAEPPVVDPPRCQHALVCQRVLVKKKNKNHGRAFFACPLGYDEGRCDYFLWEDNHAQFALHLLFNEDDAEKESVDHEPTAKVVPLDLLKPIDTQTTALQTNLRVVFGHAEFRAGQEWAIGRVFQKQRTLLVLPTGAGKSLCYQYPALFLPGITIVISPLISLMNDQFHNLPSVLQRQATCVASSSASKTQYAAFVRDLLGGKLKLLFVSPEKALTSGFQRLLTQMQSRISLVCVDEAHCISEWSHHFRPSYLRLAPLFALADSVLAITATASRRVERDILSQLTETQHSDHKESEMEMESETPQRVLRMPWQRDNLRLRVVKVSSDEERLERLCDLLTMTQVTGAVIMYVHQQWQAEAMANLLQERLVLDTSDSKKTKWTKHKIAAYHAKMEPDIKEKVRLGFLSGRVKLVIATIAFGMGIDKQNVRLVIHYHVPSSIEHYLQQVGRAGRDGRPASALLFLLDDDVRAFRSLLFSNSLHISQVHKLVELVVSKGRDAASTDFQRQNMAVVSRCNTALPPPLRSRLWLHVASLEQHLDMKAAMIETFLTLLSLDPLIQQDLRLKIHPTAMSWCVLSLTETQLTGPHADPLLKQLVASVKNNDASDSLGHVEIDVDGYHRHVRVYFHVASAAQVLLPQNTMDSDDRAIDIQSRLLMQRVRAWQASGVVRKFQMERSAFDLDLDWVEVSPNDADENERRRRCVETWTQRLYVQHNALEAMEIKRLQQLYSALSAAAAPMPTVKSFSSNQQVAEDEEENEEDGTTVLEEKLSRYFDEADAAGDNTNSDDQEAAEWRALTTPLTPDLVEAIECDVKVLTSRSPDAVVDAGDEQHQVDDGAPRAGAINWHGYNVARVFHGLASPCFLSRQWRDQLWWRKYNHVAFEKLVVLADNILAHAQGHES